MTHDQFKRAAVLLAGAVAVTSFATRAQAQDQAQVDAWVPADDNGPVDVPQTLDVSSPVNTLDAALERAYWTNPTLLAERARLEAFDFRLPQARARSGPQLNFEASYGFRRDNIEQIKGGYLPRSGWAPSASAILTQPLFTFGRNAAAERSASAQIDYQRAALQATEQQVLLQAISAYVAVRRDREAVRIAQENLDLLERELADNTARLKARDTTRTDVQQVGTRVELGRAQLLQAQRSQALAEADFLKVVGSLPGDLAPPAPFTMPARNLEDAYTIAQQVNPVLVAAYARERVSRAQISAARAERKPRVDLRGRAGLDTSLFGLERLRQTSLRGEVVVSGPIFQSGALGARIGEAEAANDADWRLIDQALRETRAEVSDAWNEWLTAEASLDNLARAVTLAEQAHRGAVQQERVGMRTTLDVLDLARDLLSARVSFNQALATAEVARVRVLSAIGVLDRETTAPGRARHDVERHYQQTQGDGDLPLITAGVQALDRIVLGSDDERDVRDPTGALLSAPAAVPVWGPVVTDADLETGLSGGAKARIDRPDDAGGRP